MLWVVILMLFIFLVIYLLFATISIYIDTATNQYYVQLKGVFKLSAESHESEILKLRLQMYFLNFNFYPFKAKKNKEPKKYLRKKRKRTFKIQQGLRLLKTFKVKRFLVDLDTGDCITNAKLFPVFAFLNYKFGHFYLNFEGRNQLVLHIQNRPIYIIKSFINL